jgi:hypothetical protein
MTQRQALRGASAVAAQRSDLSSSSTSCARWIRAPAGRAIARRVLDAHGGDSIWSCSSKSGARFVLEVPAESAERWRRFAP